MLWVAQGTELSIHPALTQGPVGARMFVCIFFGSVRYKDGPGNVLPHPSICPQHPSPSGPFMSGAVDWPCCHMHWKGSITMKLNSQRLHALLSGTPVCSPWLSPTKGLRKRKAIGGGLWTVRAWVFYHLADPNGTLASHHPLPRGARGPVGCWAGPCLHSPHASSTPP